MTGLPSVTKTFTKKKNAVAFAKQDKADTGLLRKLGRAATEIPTFRAWCDAYMNQYSGKDPSTAGRLNCWCEQIGDYAITKIDEFIVDEGLMQLDQAGRTGSTINLYKSMPSAVINHFIQYPDYKRTGYSNPVRKESVSRFKENPAKDRLLVEDEQKALLVASRASHWPKIYLLV